MSDPRNPERGLPAAPVEPEARERVVELLTRHFADDRLSAEELEARLERVYRASSIAQLEALTADLPAAAALVPPGNLPAQRIAALLSGQEQRVTGVVPRRLEVRSRLGYVELDLTRASFEPGLTEIDVRAFMGYVQIRLPAGVRVECLGRAVAGYFSLRGRAAASADAPSTVRITGRATFGFAECLVRSGARKLPDAT